METVGIRIDREFLESFAQGTSLSSADLRPDASTRWRGRSSTSTPRPNCGRSCSRSSGWSPVKKTKTGPSTGRRLTAEDGRRPSDRRRALALREVEKLRSTYADALPPLIAADGRIHATFKQIDTTTGRISSEAPNLQNVPGARATAVRCAGRSSRTELGHLHRGLLADRAGASSPPGRGPWPHRRVRRGADVHTTTAAKVFGVAEAGRRRCSARFAKVVNYGLAYGMEAYGLGQRWASDREAAEILDAYFDGFPNVKTFMVEDGARGHRSAATDDHLRAPPSDQRAVVGQLPHPPDGGCAWHRTRRCRAARPTSSNWR